MKKIFSFCVAVMAFGLFLTSCSSTHQASISRIRHNEPALSALPFEAYTVLERVTGEGQVSNQRNAAGLFVGDTGNYGSLDSVDAVYLNINANTSIAPATPFDAALANAIYQMVERADALQADAVIFVRSKTKIVDENGKNTVSVQVSGKAIKLK